jgi:hypothetical protein
MSSVFRKQSPDAEHAPDGMENVSEIDTCPGIGRFGQVVPAA